MDNIRIAALKEFRAICDAGEDLKLDDGVYKAYCACRNTDPRKYKQIADDEVVMDDFTWNDEERKMFIETLRKLGLKKMVVTNTSSVLYNDLHGYVALGCKLVGLCTIVKWDCWEHKDIEVKGIRFEL